MLIIHFPFFPASKLGEQKARHQIIFYSRRLQPAQAKACGYLLNTFYFRLSLS